MPISRLPIPGSDDGTWGEVLNDFLMVSHNADGTLVAASTIAAKAADDSVVHNTGDETVAGTKTFQASPVVPTPTLGEQAASKAYVDSVASSGAPAASATNQGLIRLGGDLGGAGGTADVPVIAADAITTSKLADGAVTALKLANATVSDVQIAANAGIAKSKLATAVQTSLALADSSVQQVNGKTPTAGAVTLNAADIGALTQTSADGRYLAGTKSAGAPGSPSVDDLWYDKTNDLWKRWSGSAWVVAGGAEAAAALQKSANLADLPSASSARMNLGLGDAATHAASDFDAAGAAAAAQAAAVQRANHTGSQTAATISDFSSAVTAVGNATYPAIVWQPSTAYSGGQIVVHQGVAYQATSGFTSGASFSAANLATLENATAHAADIATLNATILTNDGAAVHKTGVESIAGNKTFTGATAFSGSLTANGGGNVPTTPTATNLKIAAGKTAFTLSSQAGLGVTIDISSYGFSSIVSVQLTVRSGSHFPLLAFMDGAPTATSITTWVVDAFNTARSGNYDIHWLVFGT